MKTELELEMCENCEGQFPLEEMTSTMDDVCLCPECARACLEATSIFDCIEDIADCEEAGEPYVYLDELKQLLNQFGIVAGNEIGLMKSELADLRAALDEATRWIPIEDRSRPMPNDASILIKDENGRVYTWEEWDSYDSAPFVIITHWRYIDRR